MTNEDIISRQAVKSDYADWFGYGYKDNWFYRHLNNIPSVKPQDQKIGVGHQIKHELKDEDFNKDFIFYECSCCSDVIDFRCNYCPNCGVKFEGEDNEISN